MVSVAAVGLMGTQALATQAYVLQFNMWILLSAVAGVPNGTQFVGLVPLKVPLLSAPAVMVCDSVSPPILTIKSVWLNKD